MRKGTGTLLVVLIAAACVCMPLKNDCLIAQASTQEQKWVEGKAECVMELESRRILYADHAEKALPMASTTKILTAITVLQSCDNLQEEVVIPPEAAGVQGSSVYLKSGDIYTVEDLLYGLMLRSGNDCATALALRFGGNVENFAMKMNAVAQKAGALASSFQNPHGLPCKNHYTTARDLGYITCYAMQNPVFSKIVATRYYAPRRWQNKNKILTLCDGGVGVKTGYTKEAGRCLVSAVKRDNMTLICTLLNCPTTYERTIRLIDDAFQAYKREKLLSKDQVFSVTDGKTTIQASPEKDFYYPLLQEELSWIETRVKGIDNRLQTKKTGEKVGELEIYLAKRLLFSGNLYKL